VNETEALIVGLLIGVAGLGALARMIDVPYPIVLVIGGAALGFIPGIPDFVLNPDVVLLVFLPPLLYGAAFFADFQQMRRNLRPIMLLSIGLVLATMVAVAVVAHAAIPGLPWAAAFVLGAVVSPTDPLAGTSIMRRLDVPARLVSGLEGEGLFNDATALVAYRVAVGAAIGTGFSLAEAGARFVGGAAGGIAIGLVVGWLMVEIRKRIADAPISITVSLLSGYAAFVPADALGASGVLAAVTCGIFVGLRGPRVIPPRVRLQSTYVWQVLDYLLNATLFVLVGLQLRMIVDTLDGYSAGELAGYALAVSGTVILTRIVWAMATPYVIRALDRRPSQVARRIGWRSRLVSAWSGMRGAVSLAAALALPDTFPQRDMILLVTFAVILVTLVGQGLTLPAILRWASWDGNEPDGDEATVARQAAYQAGLDEIERARPLWDGHAPLFDRLESGLRDRTQHLATEDADETAERRQERLEHEEIQRGVIAAQRTAVIELRDRGEINDQTLRAVERELDLEEIRMEA